MFMKTVPRIGLEMHIAMPCRALDGHHEGGRVMRRKLFSRVVVGVTLTAVAMLSTATLARAQSPLGQACDRGRYDAAARYAQCELKATGKLASGDDSKYQKAVSRCHVKYTDAWAKLQAKGICGARFMVDGGTVRDNLTALQWEQKTDDGTVHDKDDLYSWASGDGASTAADGTAFTSFLATLNSGGCFAGQCDWRLPTRTELQTILGEPYPCMTSPCVDQGFFGPTGASFYWSSTTLASSPFYAWTVRFDDGLVNPMNKGFLDNAVRAVRGGL